MILHSSGMALIVVISIIIKMPIDKQRILRKEKPDIAAPLIHHYRDRLKPKLKEMKSKKSKANQ